MYFKEKSDELRVQKMHLIKGAFLCWQGRRDSNTQPTVLETATLPLSHSPLNVQIQFVTLYIVL